jgi:tetratricopeptide (TPR) repeat protein
MALQAGHLFGKYRDGRACQQEEEIGMVGTLARLSLGLAIVTALCLSLSLCEGRAQAAGLTAKDTARAKRAKQLYKDGQYEEAAKIFSSLSSDYPDTLVLTRNLGACYYYLRRPEPALSNLREYLRRAHDISAEDRSEVEGWMAEMEKLRGQPAPSPSPAPAPPAPPVLPVTAAAAPAPASSAPAPSSPTPATPSPASAGAPSQPSNPAISAATVTTTPQAPARSYSTLAWIAGGIGVVGLAGGGVCTALALSKFSSTESQYNPSAESAGKTYAALQWVGYGVGAAGIATAILLFTLNPSASSPVALTPMLGQGFAGAGVAGTY